MLILTCPHCGVAAEETELSPGGEAHLKRFGPGSTRMRNSKAYMFARTNPKRRAFRTLAPQLRLRQVVPGGPQYRHAGGLWHLSGPDPGTPGGDHREDPGPGARSGRAGNEHAAFPGRAPDRPDRRPCEFTFNGKRMRGYRGDTLASALLANDQLMVGRSFKYHRPARHRRLGAGRAERAGRPWHRRPRGAEPARHHDRAVRRPRPRSARTTGPAWNSTSGR
jgi:hypothetical protein